MGDRRLPPPVYALDEAGLVRYGLDNYGLTGLKPEMGKQALVCAIQDAKQVIPEGQDPATDAGEDEIPPSAPDQSPPPALLAGMKQPPPMPRATEGSPPEQGRNFEPGPGAVGASEPMPVQPENKFAPGPPREGPLVDSDPPMDPAHADQNRLDIPEGYELPDFEDEQPDQFDALRTRMNPDMAKQGLVNKMFRHPPGTQWLYNPMTDVFWKPTETLMQNKELVPVMGDPPQGSNIGSA